MFILASVLLVRKVGKCDIFSDNYDLKFRYLSVFFVVAIDLSKINHGGGK